MEVLKEPAVESGASSSSAAADNRLLLNGREVVFTSDLIAAKKSLEGQLAQQQTVHGEAMDKAKLDLSDAQKQIAQLNARLTESEQARQSGAAAAEEAARVKQELEAAKSGQEQAVSRVLELRRANIVLASRGVVTEAQLKDRTLSQLDAFEEALKALASARSSPGSYATGSGLGSAATETPMERAARVLATTPVRGTRTAETKV